jgi:hypothetical protein
MKSLFFATCITVLLTSCVTCRSFDLNLLTFGRTKKEVTSTVGRPNRIFAERQTENGYGSGSESSPANKQQTAGSFGGEWSQKID